MMTSSAVDLGGLVRETRALKERRARGDLSEKAFGRALAEATVRFFREVVTARLAPAETVRCEHHVARGHLKLSRSVMRDPAEESIGLFVTERRLVRVRATMMVDGASIAEASSAVIDEIPLERIRRLEPRRQIRASEAVAGAMIAALALLLAPVLLFTGKVLLALGLLGILHGLLLPTRWVEVETDEPMPQPPLEILALRRQSARRLLAHLRESLAAAGTRESALRPVTGDAEEVAAVARPRVMAPERPVRVLIVDDEAVFREALAKVLRRRGIDPTLAAEGEAGLERLRRELFDVVVLDLRMPGLDGLEVLRRMRESRPEVPVILLTGHGDAASGLEAIRQQAFNFLLKPIAPDRLVLEIEAAAGRAGTAAGGTVSAKPDGD